MASYGLHSNNGPLSSTALSASYTIQSNLENLIANHVLSPHQESARRFSDSSQHGGNRPNLQRSHPSIIPEEQPLMDDDEEDEEILHDDSRSGRDSATSHSRSESGRGLDVLANAFNQVGRRPSVLASFTDQFSERRESMISHYSASDRARLSKLTTIVSGAETGEPMDEANLHPVHHLRSKSVSPKLPSGFARFTPIDPEAQPIHPGGPQGDEDYEDVAETHMLLDPATELDPIVDLELPHDADGHISTTWWNGVLTETRVLVKSAAPILGTQLLEYSLPLASVISIGHLSTTDLAASALANMTAAVTGYSILQGFIASLDVVMPAAWTSSEPYRVGFWLQRCAIAVSILILPIVAIWLSAEKILLKLGQSEEVSYRAGLYMKYLVIGLPGYALNLMMRKYFMAQNLQSVHSVISSIVAPLNLGFNYLLVWGPPSVRLGFIGAPLTTSMSFNLSATLAVIWAVFFAPKTAWNGWGGFPLRDAIFLAIQGTFGALQVASEWWAWEICGLMVATLGEVPLAVNSVLLSFSSILFQVPSSGGNAAANRIGNLLGANQPMEASLASKVAMSLAVLASAFNSAILVIFRHHIAYIFTSDPVVAAGVAKLTIYVALFQIADGIVGVAGGTMRVLDLVRKGAIINLIAYYIIGLPLGAYLCFKHDMGLRGLWIGLSTGITFAGVASAWLLLRVDWEATVTLVRLKLGLSNVPATEEDGETTPIRKSYGTISH